MKHEGKMTTTQRHDCAVAFCCDRNYFPFALFMIRQIAFHNPFRRFDFVVASHDDLTVPDWAKPLGITIHRSGALPEAAEVGRFFGSMAPYLRICLARELGDRYRRILYLDCDMFVEGGDINRLLEIDLGGHPLAAVIDAPFFFAGPTFRAKEFAVAGLPAMPFFNTGLQVIDTRVYQEQDLERRSFEVCTTHPRAIVNADQSLTNLALRGKFAQLAPCWNWQLNGRLPLIPMRYPVFMRHFISRLKPDQDPQGWHDARFNHAYREFMTLFAPELLPKLSPPGNTAPMSLRAASGMLVRHIRTMSYVAEIIRRHPDPYKAII
jgi:lipopolysaccharide biosynthesis glycosyltransferase